MISSNVWGSVTPACASSICSAAGDRGFDDRGGVAGVRTLQRHGDHGTRLQIDGMLRFVRQMRFARLSSSR
jgi:hypothetical protein